MEVSMVDLTRGLASPGLLAVLRERELEVELEVTQPSIVIDSGLLIDIMRTDGFGIVADVIHDPTLEVELEVIFDASAEALGDAWFLASEDVVAATEAVWLRQVPEPRIAMPVRLALIAALVVAVTLVAAAL